MQVSKLRMEKLILGESKMIFNRLILFVLFMTATCFGADANNGAKLFDGTKSFENGGVSCVACHNVQSSLVISGGVLAMDLSAMGGAIEYILSSVDAMSSDVMKVAYKDKMLTKSEIADIDAFLIQAAAEPGEGYGSNFVMLGFILAAILYVLLSMLNRRKKLKKSVNQDIYDRQMKTSWRN